MSTEALSVMVGAASAIAALAALFVAYRNERRARLIAATQLILTLSAGFHEIFPRLGLLDEDAKGEGEKEARDQYWHHAYLEWFLTNKFAPRDFKVAWDDYFLRANLSGYAHRGLRCHLNEAAAKEDEGFGFYAREYIEAIRAAAEAEKLPRD